MTEALEALGDAYGVYGFSGYGREQVEFYVAKDFAESGDRPRAGASPRSSRSARRAWVPRSATPRASCAQDARVRTCSSSPTAIRRTSTTARTAPAPTALQDTMMALREAELQGIHTFCLTVDRPETTTCARCAPRRQYLVIDDVASLPRELPKVYRGLTT